MRVDLQVIARSNGHYHDRDGIIKLIDNAGNVTWEYQRRKHTGIGIAACARSATQYIHQVLRQLGYMVGHEAMGIDGSVGYHLAVVRPENCFHQVRHPLDQISSMVAHKSWGFIPSVMYLPDFDLFGCMKYWLEWNKMCEEFCVWRYRIEDLPSVWDEFLERIGHAPCEIPSVPKNMNTQDAFGKFRHYTWNDLFHEDATLAGSIMSLAEKYGYDVPEEDKALYQTSLGELETAQVSNM